MQENGEFDMDLMSHKYCVSWIALRVCNVGIQQFTAAWNHHYIPGGLHNIIKSMFAYHPLFIRQRDPQ